LDGKREDAFLLPPTAPEIRIKSQLTNGLVIIGGALIKEQSLGPIVNTILGLIGGVGGSQLLGALGRAGLRTLGHGAV
jgi:uncharacterized membrane protein YeaQ/YmgE (transglycosylase-associated protein family)